ncbi:hypothetical protein, conserved [Eimeria praecox]|uniref:Uncharacterized protein n=1 Tax=Eimeria praecox TaxID=51316 RepID=U6G576_9EIME|nr:hypothetical protein, conserved [Eimeria praecox]
MDRVPDSKVQQSAAKTRTSTLTSSASARFVSMRSELLERLRICAALDKRFFKAWFDELDMERCSNFSSDLCIDSQCNWGIYSQESESQEATDAAFRRISFELQNLEDRERRLTAHVEALNRQYEDLITELTEPLYNGAVLVPGCSTPPMSAAQRLSRLPRIAIVISAKEEEQRNHMYYLRHWNVNISGVNIPNLPRLLRKLPAEEGA